MSDRTRRRFLATTGVAGLSATGGCLELVRDRLRQRRRRLQRTEWPPPKPDDLPDNDEVPDLAPLTLGDDSATPVAVYEDIGTSEAGEFFHEELPSLRGWADRGRIQLTYRDFPLPWNDWSYPIAIAGRAVQHYAGQEAFWSFAKRVTRRFRPDIDYTKERVLTAAEEVGAPPEKIQTDVEDWRFFSIVQSDKHRGEQYGIQSVPRSVLGPKDEQLVMSGAAAGRIISALEAKIEDPDSDPTD